MSSCPGSNAPTQTTPGPSVQIVETTGDHALAERVAGHKGKSTLARHYDKSKRLDPMLAALMAWADAVDDAAARAALVEESNVAPLRPSLIRSG